VTLGEGIRRSPASAPPIPADKKSSETGEQKSWEGKKAVPVPVVVELLPLRERLAT
jgi:hypothetical protein